MTKILSSYFCYPWFLVDKLNRFIILGVIIFSFFTLLYSFKFMSKRAHFFQYYAYVILTALASAGAVLANNLIVLLIMWGFLGFMLYLLVAMGDERSNIAAKKTFIIVGGTDALMLFGICIIYYLTRTFQMDNIRLQLNSGLTVAAYLCIVSACFAKAGAMPLHSWIPDCAKSAPLPVTAFLPASLDKLLGIYLLARVSFNLFAMNKWANGFLMLAGALTIIAGVMMALVQHNLKRLLGYHAVSQVGYMILGIGTGNAVGIAGGLFHMLNNVVYKSCLFFTAGNVEYRAKTSELDNLGGLAKLMPLTYISCLIASLSIAGVPPLNGFVSKWMIYQGLLYRIKDGGSHIGLLFSVFCLMAAMFGSGLTLASFMKLIHAVFLGQRLNTSQDEKIKEVSWSMWVPCIALAFICVLFGVFAFAVPLKYFIFPAISAYRPMDASALPGNWSPKLATLLLLMALIIGFIVFKLSKLSFRRDSAFAGGEISEIKKENMVTGTEFYNTVREIGFLKNIYKRAEGGFFDIYEQGKKIFSVSGIFQYLHNGVLPTYLIWILLGMMGLFFAFLR